MHEEQTAVTETPIEHVYAVVCKDIPLQHQAVQACHACIAAGREIISIPTPYLVVLTVPDEAALIALSNKLNDNGVQHRVFREDDMGGRATALATQNLNHRQRDLFIGIKLYRTEKKPFRRRFSRRR
jgi:hypothetical protein